ncbi:MAG: Uma2 family endonuclease [Candidatus Velthaea sp.]
MSKKDRQSPNVPPEIVVEILSPDDRPKDVEAKRKEYLTWGVSLVLIADPDARYVDVFDSAGTYERIDASVESYSPAIIPDLVLPLRAMFAKLDLDIPDTERSAILHAVALTGDRHHVRGMNEPVQGGVSENRIDEHFGLQLKRFV